MLQLAMYEYYIIKVWYYVSRYEQNNFRTDDSRATDFSVARLQHSTGVKASVLMFGVGRGAWCPSGYIIPHSFSYIIPHMWVSGG